jgi:hypothetical protein
LKYLKQRAVLISPRITMRFETLYDHSPLPSLFADFRTDGMVS